MTAPTKLEVFTQGGECRHSLTIITGDLDYVALVASRHVEDQEFSMAQGFATIVEALQELAQRIDDDYGMTVFVDGETTTDSDLAAYERRHGVNETRGPIHTRQLEIVAEIEDHDGEEVTK